MQTDNIKLGMLMLSQSAASLIKTEPTTPRKEHISVKVGFPPQPVKISGRRAEDYLLPSDKARLNLTVDSTFLRRKNTQWDPV